MITMQNDVAYWTPLYAVFRWDENLCPRPGTYRVVALSQAYELIRMGQKEVAGWDHPTCVVDDFGNLVAVPA